MPSDSDLSAYNPTSSFPSKTCKFTYITKAILPVGYDIFHVPRFYSGGGGVALVFKDCITMKPQRSKRYISFEYLECIIQLGLKHIRIVSVYRPPPSEANGFTFNQFLNEFTCLLEMHTVSTGQLLILGDFNFHVDNVNDRIVLRFLDILSLFNLTQHVNVPTHEMGHTLDLVITRASEDLLCNLSVYDPKISDHSAILFNIRHKKIKYQQKTFTYRPIKHINESNFINDVQNTIASLPSTHTADQPLSESPSDLNDLVSHYNNTMSTLIDAHAPEITKTITVRPDTPWFNREILLAKQLRRKYEHAWQRAKKKECCSEYETRYINQCNHVKDLILKTKCNFYNVKVEATKGDQKELFRLLNTIFSNSQKQPLPSHESLEQLSSRFSDFYVAKIEKIRDQISHNSPPDTVHIEEACTVSHPLNEFAPATMTEIRDIIGSSPNKSCSLDPIPTELLKKCGDPIFELILQIVNMSLSTAHMPSELKRAVLIPILKKLFLDPEILNNFRPISNLPFISKIIEKVVASRLNDHLNINGLNDVLQSAYKKLHSTETALLNVTDDILGALDVKKLAMLIMQDLSAAFDTVDHDILLKRMEYRLGIKGKALQWFRSYLTDRTQSVLINGTESNSAPLKYGVPQGSVLGPLLFSIYTLPLGDILRKYDVPYHFYADDNQEYAFFEVQDYKLTAHKMECLVHDMRTWYSNNFLMSNDSKTEILILFSKFSPTFYKFPIVVGDYAMNPTTSVKNLGVTFDQNLNMINHINHLVSLAFLKIREIYFHRRYLTKESLETLVHAYITNRVDYCNSLLVGLPNNLLRKLQSILNASARLVSGTRKYDHITPVLKDLHWLPIKQRIKFKILLTVYKCYNGLAPLYLRNRLTPYSNPRLRSSKKRLLVIPKSRTKTYGDRRFSVADSKYKNALPLDISPSLVTFISKLITHLFDEAYHS